MQTQSERTRQRLADAALDLFEAHGYTQTTTAQIAAAAGVSEMTLFRHYPSKDRLLLDDPYDPVIAAAVATQPRRLPTLARVTSGIREAWHAMPEPEEATRRRLRIAAGTPGLAGAIRVNTQATETAITHALTVDGTDPTIARIAAAAALGALMESLTAWAAADDDRSLGDAVRLALDVLDEAVRR